MSNKKNHSIAPTARFMELEGLRGLASLMVAVYHCLLAFYAFMFFGYGFQNMRLEDNLYGNPIAVFLSGTFAVAVFFVLSGFVLSVGFFRSKSIDSVRRLAVKRYSRLMLPALVSTIVCYILIKLGLSFTQDAANLTQSGWLRASWGFVPDFGQAISSGLIGIFATGGSAYNNVLWTMKIELIGSFVVFGFILLFGNSQHRWILYLLSLVLAFNMGVWYMAFIVGMLLADLYTSGYLSQKSRAIPFITGVLAIALFFGGYPYASVEGTMYQKFVIPGVQMQALSTIIGASILVGLIMSTKQLSSLFRHRYLSALGKYSFSLYLIHLPVIYSLTVGLFVLLRAHFGYNTSFALAFSASIPVVVLSTILFYRYVEAPSVRFANGFEKIYSSETTVYKVLFKRFATLRRRIRSQVPASAAVEPE